MAVPVAPRDLRRPEVGSDNRGYCIVLAVFQLYRDRESVGRRSRCGTREEETNELSCGLIGRKSDDFVTSGDDLIVRVSLYHGGERQLTRPMMENEIRGVAS